MILVTLRVVCLAVLAAASGAACTTQSSAQGQAQDEVVARIGDTALTFGDVDEAWHREDPRGRLQALQDLYEERLRVLDSVVGDLLIDREAEARGVSREELLAEELPPRTTEVTEDEIERIYERNRDRFGGRTFEDMRPEIRQILEQQRPAMALFEYMDELREVSDDVSIMLDPPRQQIEVDASDRSRGPADAPVVIVEFSDFECPYCGRATATLAALMDRYPERIRFVYKDFPLPNHPNAFKAAEAGHCAHEQGMFWELHDRMFGMQDALDVESLKAYADDLGLDADEFNACLDDGRHAPSVDREMAAGRGYGTTSTPTLFINGRAVFGALPLDVFDRIVREELDAAARR